MDLLLNESFKAFVREAFPNKSDIVLKVFQEVVNDRATTAQMSVENIKAKAIDEIKKEFATKDFLSAQTAQIRKEMADLKVELKADIADVRSEIADVRSEIAKTKVDILKWVLGMQIATITIILAGMRFIVN